MHESPTTTRLRRRLLLLVAVGLAGLAAELALLGHWRAPLQLVPLAALAVAAASTAALALRPARAAVLAFRGAMALALVAGFAGIGLHLNDNLALEREIAPRASTAEQLREAIRGATPALAPGSLALVGLLGLTLTYRHPSLEERP